MANRLVCCVVQLLILVSSTALAQTGKISGYMFGDVYWVAANHDAGLEGENGFWFRRIYFTYDQAVAEEFAVRFRLEMNSPGDFRTKAKLSPTVKDAYLKWSRGDHNLYVGLSSTPTWEVVEKTWGYRSVEKTPLDLQKFGSSRDFGVALRGTLDPDKRVAYHLMLGNGNGTSAETNQGKKVLLSVRVQLTDHLFVEGYGDWDDRPGHTDRFTAQGFVAYTNTNVRAGVQLVNQTRQQGEGFSNRNLQIGSVFVAGKLGEKTWGFARVDRTFDRNPDSAKNSYLPFSPTAKSTFFLAGIDYAPENSVHIMPNVEVVAYDGAAGEAPDADIIPRVTFFFQWN